MTTAMAEQMIGETAYDKNGDKIGKVGQVFLDDTTGQPEFFTVNTGFFGTSESFVPASNAVMDSDGLKVPFEKDMVKDAPKVDLDGGHLDAAEEEKLYAYYGMTYGAGDTGSGTEGYVTSSGNVGSTDDVTPAAAGYAATDSPAGTSADFATGTDTSGPVTDSAMTRSEEHLEATKTTQESGKARLRKYVTTEQESITVPVTKERAVLTSEPITEANMPAATDGPAISEEEHEVTLHEEVASAQAVAVPVERVALGTESVVVNETVSGDVRKENVEVEGDVDQSGTTGTV